MKLRVFSFGTLRSFPQEARAGSLRAFVPDARASAGIEFALGAAVLLGVAALCFDLYARVEADTAAARAAATMADYVSRGADADDKALDGDALQALGKFLHAHELSSAAHLVFVVSALHRPAGTRRAEVLWTDDRLRFGAKKVTGKLAKRCSRFVRTNRKGKARAAKPLPGKFTLAAGEVVAVVELCARLVGAGSLTGRFVAGDIYRHHVLPVRAPEKAFPAPAHAWRAGAAVTRG